MKKIDFDTIELASEEINELDDQKVDALIEKFSNEQPYIMTYLMAIYDEDLSEEERELLFFIGIKIWYTFLKIAKNIPIITEEEIDNAEADNDDMLNYLEAEDEEGFESFTESLMENYAQSELFNFALAGLMDDEEEDDAYNISEEVRGAMLIALKTVIDCFDKKIA